MTDTHAYLGIKPCGCAVSVIVDMAAHPDDVAEWVAEEIRDGLHIERVPIDDACSRIGPCRCDSSAPVVHPDQGVLL